MVVETVVGRLGLVPNPVPVADPMLAIDVLLSANDPLGELNGVPVVEDDTDDR
jgi:hypothetical protein